MNFSSANDLNIVVPCSRMLISAVHELKIVASNKIINIAIKHSSGGSMLVILLNIKKFH